MQELLVRHLPDLALAAALAWGAGLRLYLTAFVLGAAAALGWLPLPEHLHSLAHPMVIAVAGFMAFVELFADKIPWLDSLWDALHTLIRIPAGAALAAAVFGDAGTAAATAAALFGGSIAATSHFTKAGTRAVVNASPEPFTNIALSLGEEGLVLGGLWLAVQHPLVFLVLLVVFLVLALLMLRMILRGLGRLVARFSGQGRAASTPAGRAR